MLLLYEKVENLRSTCSLTELVLSGKDIELLLLKKDVEEKLSLLNSVDVKTLPNTTNKSVSFLPGQVDLGRLEDADNPNLSSMRMGKNGPQQSDHSKSGILCF